MQGPTRTKEIGGRTYTARQPTLSEMCNFFDSPPPSLEGFELLDAFLLSDEEMAITDLLMLSDATEEDLKGMTEDEILSLALLCKENNPRFFQMRSKAGQLGREIAQLPPPG